MPLKVANALHLRVLRGEMNVGDITRMIARLLGFRLGLHRPPVGGSVTMVSCLASPVMDTSRPRSVIGKMRVSRKRAVSDNLAGSPGRPIRQAFLAGPRHTAERQRCQAHFRAFVEVLICTRTA